MVLSSKCADCKAVTRKDQRDARTQFAFFGCSAAGCRITAEDELEQLSGSGHSSMLALRRTLS